MKGVKKTLKTRFILNSAGLERKPAAHKMGIYANL